MKEFSADLMNALESQYAAKKIKILHIKGELKKHLPTVDRLFDVPESLVHHPEGNAGEHTLLSLKETKDEKPMLKYAMLLHDIGKVVTFDSQIAACEQKGEAYQEKDLTKHFGHADKGIPLVEDISDTLGVPTEWKEFAVLVCKQHMKAHDLLKMKDAKLFEFNQEIPDKYFEPLMQCCLADAMARDIPEETKQIARGEFSSGLNRVTEIRDYMKNHPEDTKETFANNFARYKKQQDAILDSKSEQKQQ